MRKVFYLCQHGETEDIRLNFLQGRNNDSSLNENGWQQAKELAEALEEKAVEIVWSSPLGRAMQTATIMAYHLNVPLKFSDCLSEADFGLAEDKHLSEIRRRWPEVSRNWNNPDASFVQFPEGESRADILKRCQRVFSNILWLPEDVIAIVSHRTVLQVFLSSLDGGKQKLSPTEPVKLVWDTGWHLD